MKLLSLILLFACLSNGLAVAQSPVNMMTYNIRLATERDGENAWSKRKADVAGLIKRRQPAILGVQEALQEQMTYLDSTLTHYAFIGVGRDDAATAGEYSAIFYDSTLLNCIASETFWLSETPQEPSYGWGVNYRRICTYGSFVFRGSADTIHVFNTHFDHEVELARLNSAQLILDRMEEKKLAHSKVILMGDFNCTLADPPMQRLNAKFEFPASITVGYQFGPKSTFSGFKSGLQEGKVIDYILGRNVKFITYRHILDRRPNGRWPSDHVPVMATVSFR